MEGATILDPRIAETRAALLARARDLAPALHARVAEADAARRVPDASIAALRAADLFRILQPARHGGLELDLESYARAVLALGRGCGATAWVYGALALHQWLIGLFPGEAQDEVWSGDGLAAASYAPAGAAVAADGGWRLSGTWAKVGGSANAGWLILGCRAGADGQALALVRRTDVRLEDDPAVLGLAGAGSRNVIARDVAVPRHRMLDVADAGAPPGARVNPGPLYRIPFVAAVGTGLSLPAVAIAGGALDDYIATTRARTTRGAAVGGNRSMADFPTIQLRVAEAASLIDAAELLLCRDAADTYAAAAAGAALTAEQRLRNRRDHAFATRLAVQAVDRLFESAGGQGLFSSHPMQRAWRDVHAAAMHVSLNWDAVGTLVGRGMLGLPVDSPQL